VKRHIYPLLALVLLGGIAVHRFAAARPAPGVVEYHERVRLAAEGISRHTEQWVGQDVEVPAQALSVLAPNIIISRRYLNIENGSTAGFMLVHCSDAHDMAGHFPPRCYPAQGWRVRSAVPRDWTIGARTVSGMEYEFYRSEDGIEGGGERSIIVANFLMRPGVLVRDMNELARTVMGSVAQASGAGQIQVYFDGQVPEAQRNETIEQLVAAYEPAIAAIVEWDPTQQN
jgi:hypothetical protein